MSYGRDAQDIQYYAKRYMEADISDADRYFRLAAKLYALSERKRDLILLWVEALKDAGVEEKKASELRDALREEAAQIIVNGRYI